MDGAAKKLVQAHDPYTHVKVQRPSPESIVLDTSKKGLLLLAKACAYPFRQLRLQEK